MHGNNINGKEKIIYNSFMSHHYMCEVATKTNVMGMSIMLIISPIVYSSKGDGDSLT